jgi:hypothetical protein
VQKLKPVRTSGFDGTNTEESELKSKPGLKSKRRQSTAPMSGKKIIFPMRNNKSTINPWRSPPSLSHLIGNKN